MKLLLPLSSIAFQKALHYHVHPLFICTLDDCAACLKVLLTLLQLSLLGKLPLENQMKHFPMRSQNYSIGLNKFSINCHKVEINPTNLYENSPMDMYAGAWYLAKGICWNLDCAGFHLFMNSHEHIAS